MGGRCAIGPTAEERFIQLSKEDRDTAGHTPTVAAAPILDTTVRDSAAMRRTEENQAAHAGGNGRPDPCQNGRMITGSRTLSDHRREPPQVASIAAQSPYGAEIF